MNKRQAKKKEKKCVLINGSYREDREYMRIFHEHMISQIHSKVTPEDVEILIELGIYTKKEIADILYSPKKNRQRKRWIRKAVR